MVGSGLLLRACLEEDKRSILGRLVMWMAVADLSVNTWTYVPCWIVNRTLFMTPVVPWCWLFAPVQRTLQLWSATLPSGVALAVLLALLKLPSLVKWMHFVPAASLPAAILLNVGVYMHSSSFQYMADGEPQAYCSFNYAGDDPPLFVIYSFGIEVLCIFTVISATHLFGLWKLKKSAPGGVTRRAFNSASRFLLAFVAAWLASVVYALTIFCNKWLNNECFHRCRTSLWPWVASSTTWLIGEQVSRRTSSSAGS